MLNMVLAFVVVAFQTAASESSIVFHPGGKFLHVEGEAETSGDKVLESSLRKSSKTFLQLLQDACSLTPAQSKKIFMAMQRDEWFLRRDFRLLLGEPSQQVKSRSLVDLERRYRNLPCGENTFGVRVLSSTLSDEQRKMLSQHLFAGALNLLYSSVSVSLETKEKLGLELGGHIAKHHDIVGNPDGQNYLLRKTIRKMKASAPSSSGAVREYNRIESWLRQL